MTFPWLICFAHAAREKKRLYANFRFLKIVSLLLPTTQARGRVQESTEKRIDILVDEILVNETHGLEKEKDFLGLVIFIYPLCVHFVLVHHLFSHSPSSSFYYYRYYNLNIIKIMHRIAWTQKSSKTKQMLNDSAFAAATAAAGRIMFLKPQGAAFGVLHLNILLPSFHCEIATLFRFLDKAMHLICFVVAHSFCYCYCYLIARKDSCRVSSSRALIMNLKSAEY